MKHLRGACHGMGSDTWSCHAECDTCNEGKIDRVRSKVSQKHRDGSVTLWVFKGPFGRPPNNAPKAAETAPLVSRPPNSNVEAAVGASEDLSYQMAEEATSDARELVMIAMALYPARVSRIGWVLRARRNEPLELELDPEVPFVLIVVLLPPGQKMIWKPGPF